MESLFKLVALILAMFGIAMLKFAVASFGKDGKTFEVASVLSMLSIILASVAAMADNFWRLQ